MRIGMLTLCAVLAGCAATDNPPATIKQGGNLETARAACAKRGLREGSYNYEVCYRNRPEVQAYERDGRMNGLGIIHNNRSLYNSARGRSYPVE